MFEGLKIYNRETLKPYPNLGFLFTGQGPNFLNRRFISGFEQLYNSSPSYQRVFLIAKAVLKTDFADMIVKQDQRLRDPEFAQPALVLMSIANLNEYFLKNPELRKHSPAVLAGHSLGELTALIVSGVVSFEDGLKIARLRGEIMKTGSGAMIAVPASDEEAVREAQKLFKLDLAVINGPGQVVLSGTADNIGKAEKFLKQKNIQITLLPITIAAHSKIMEKPQEEFIRELKSFQFNNSQIPIVSVYEPQMRHNGEEIKGAFIQQLTHTLNFPEMITLAKKEGVDHFIEFGAVLPILAKLVNALGLDVKTESVYDEASIEKKFGDFYPNASAETLT